MNACTACILTLDEMQELKSKIKSTQKQLFHLNIKSAVAGIRIKGEPKDQSDVEFIDPKMLLPAKKEEPQKEFEFSEALKLSDTQTESEDELPPEVPIKDDSESQEDEADKGRAKRTRTKEPFYAEEGSDEESDSDSDGDPEDPSTTEQSEDPCDSKACSRDQGMTPYAEIFQQTGMLKCHLCPRDHPTYKMLLAHTRKHHKIAPKLTCLLCKTGFRSNDLEDHAKYHADKTAFTCSVCQKQFLTGKRLKIHQIGIQQIGESNFNCDQCGKKFAAKTSLRLHMIVHQDGREVFPCTQCDKSKLKSWSPFNLLKIRQIITSHRLSSEYMSAPALSEHVLQFHEQKWSLVCEVCGMGFATKALLSIHMRCHKSRKTLCDICLQYVSNVSKHKQRKHTTKEPIQCQECNKPIAAAYFRSHTKDIHGERKEFPCAICGKLFYSQKTWKVHMDLHAGVVYPCRVCGREFGNQGNRTKHERAKHSVEFQQLRKKPATTSPLN